MVRTGDIYLIPLLPGQQVLATILGLGVPPWNPRLAVMLVGVYECLVMDVPAIGFPNTLMQRFWCVCSFVEEGKWSLVRRATPTGSELPSSADSVWATHELFLDDLRQRFGLERQTYKGAEFTFSNDCKGCGTSLHRGFARCPKCPSVREEFRGLERFVADQVGRCCLSGACSDVRDSDGNYYWAPYFIDRVRTGEIKNIVEDL